jgi:preprotein translocase subunit SecG
VIYVVYAIHIITCIFLILVVLLQQGKGADLSVFGGGTTQAAFGARGAATLLHKLTVGFFILFMVTTVSIGILQRGRRASSVMQGVEAPAQTTPATAPVAPVVPAPQDAQPQDSSAPAEDSSAPAFPPDTVIEVAPAEAAPATEGDGGAATPPESGATEPPSN